MKTWLFVVSLVVVASACGPAQSDCSCALSTLGGPRELACGESICIGADQYQCGLRGAVTVSASGCMAPTAPQRCTPRACDGACGPVADGCGGTLQCGGCASGQKCTAQSTCEAACAGVTCATGQRCEPMTGACVADACAQANAVCGVVGGQSCGTCPGTSACASTKTACVETVAAVPLQYINSTALVGGRLFLEGSNSTSAMGRDLYAVDLVTKQVESLATGTVRSPLATSGQAVFWTDSTGVRRLAGAPGSQPSTITGLADWCTDLLVTAQHVYCSVGGSPRYGVSAFGIKRLPIAGGTWTWARSSLNYARLAWAAPYLFYVGSTDNFSSFKVLGAVDTTNADDQTVVSGGPLDGSFVMVDENAFYFVENATGGAKLNRAPFAGGASTVVLTGQWLDRKTTVLSGDAVFSVAKVGGVDGLWRAPLTQPGTPALVLSGADLGVTTTRSTTQLHAHGGGWLFVTGSSVQRTVGPAQ